MMAGCFPDFRERATSFDLHHLHSIHRKSVLSRLFRSKSDSGLKIGHKSPTGSPSISPRASPSTPHRRRFARVIRDSEAQGEEYVNPHVVRKYNKGYLMKSASLDESEHPLPYKVTGHTILKKHDSVDLPTSIHDNHDNQSSPGNHKHACFNEDVEVVEFDAKVKCKFIKNQACVMHERLHDDVEDGTPSELQRFENIHLSKHITDSIEEDDTFYEPPQPVPDATEEQDSCEKAAEGVSALQEDVQVDYKSHVELTTTVSESVMETGVEKLTSKTANDKLHTSTVSESARETGFENFTSNTENDKLHLSRKPCVVDNKTQPMKQMPNFIHGENIW